MSFRLNKLMNKMIRLLKLTLSCFKTSSKRKRNKRFKRMILQFSQIQSNRTLKQLQIILLQLKTLLREHNRHCQFRYKMFQSIKHPLPTRNRLIKRKKLSILALKKAHLLTRRRSRIALTKLWLRGVNNPKTINPKTQMSKSFHKV